MGTQRLEAFTDGVIAIVITIMVLEIKVPHGATPEALLASLPILL
ncbi:MAG: TMEM175 family protein, partial [Pseudolabrys sp.]